MSGGNNTGASSGDHAPGGDGQGANNNDLLTASNLDQLGQQQQPQEEQQNATDDEEVEFYVPPPATTNERLEQARIFLSDEDVNVSQEFTRKHQEIEAYLRRISDEKMPCNAQVYSDVKTMLFVHQVRMDKQKYEGNRPIDYNRLPKNSKRLGLRDTSERASLRGAPLREDHPPFTIERKDDQQEFLRAFRANTEQGRALRAREAAAYDATILDSTLVNEYLEERAADDETEDDKIERFNVRATKRGRRRAAVQIALRSFARNGEQHFAGGWDHRVVRLPPPPVQEHAEPAMFAPLDREQQPRAIHPYRYTRRILQFQETQREWEEGINLKLATEPSNKWYKWMDFPNPSHKPTIIRARAENRVRVLALLTFDVLIKMGSQENQGLGNKTEASVFFNEFALPVTETTGDVDLPQQTKVMLVLEFFSTDRGWPDRYLEVRAESNPLSPQAIAALQQYIDSRSPMINATVDKLITRLGTELADVWSQLINNSLAEDETANRKTALFALARTRQYKIARDLRRNKDPRTTAPLRELAQPLNRDEAELTGAEAVHLMSDQILKENNENKRPRRVPLNETWSFASQVPKEAKNRNFFSIEHWSGFTPIRSGEEVHMTAAGKRKAAIDDDSLSLPPSQRQRADDIDDSSSRPRRQNNAVAYEPLNPDNSNSSRRLPPEEIGFVQIEESPQAHTPAVGSGELMPPEIKNFDYQRDGHVLENAPDMKEDHQEGPPSFPFAETPLMQVLLGRQIEDDMAPGTLAAAAQSTTADDISILLSTQQFSLPRPATGVSAEILNDAGVFTQRLPSMPRPRAAPTRSSAKRRYTHDDDDDDKRGKRGAKRRQTGRPGDEEIPTGQSTGPNGTNGSNDVNNQNDGTGNTGTSRLRAGLPIIHVKDTSTKPTGSGVHPVRSQEPIEKTWSNYFGLSPRLGPSKPPKVQSNPASGLLGIPKSESATDSESEPTPSRPPPRSPLNIGPGSSKIPSVAPIPDLGSASDNDSPETEKPVAPISASWIDRPAGGILVVQPPAGTDPTPPSNLTWKPDQGLKFGPKTPAARRKPKSPTNPTGAPGDGVYIGPNSPLAPKPSNKLSALTWKPGDGLKFGPKTPAKPAEGTSPTDLTWKPNQGVKFVRQPLSALKQEGAEEVVADENDGDAWTDEDGGEEELMDDDDDSAWTDEDEDDDTYYDEEEQEQEEDEEEVEEEGGAGKRELTEAKKRKAHARRDWRQWFSRGGKS